MRTRRGRSAESVIARLDPDREQDSWPIRSQVKRPVLSQFERNRRLSPQERIDRAFALLEFADSLRDRRGVKR